MRKFLYNDDSDEDNDDKDEEKKEDSEDSKSNVLEKAMPNAGAVVNGGVEENDKEKGEVEEKEAKSKKSKKNKKNKKKKKSKKDSSDDSDDSDSDDDSSGEEGWEEKRKPTGIQDEEGQETVGPVPLVDMDGLDVGHIRSDYGRALLPGEGAAMAAYVQEGKRIPRGGT